MNDLETVIQRIKEDYNDNANFVLWGRSMGAVSILRYLMNREDQSIYLAILDSPFLDVK